MTVQISVLGAVEATSDGRAIDLGSPQQRTLLALLAVRAGAVVPVEAIIDALWPDDPPASAAKVVQTYVSRLRKSLGDSVIERRGNGYALSRGSVEVDSLRFDQQVQAEEYNAALDLWRGPALADVTAAPPLRQEAERLEELRLRAMEERFDSELAAGRAAAIVGDLQALVAAHPMRERLVARLMLALYGAGRQAEALETYRVARRTLSEQVGLEPGDDLRELERRILEQDPALKQGPVEPVGVPVEETPPPSAPGRRRRLRLRILLPGVVVLAAAGTAAFSFGHGSAHAVVPVANSIIRIDPKTNKVVEDIHVGREPSGIVATHGAVWVANEQDRTLTRFDTRTHEEQTIGGLRGVGFVTSDEHGNLYASGWDYPYVWLIDPKSVARVGTFRVRSRAVGMAVGGGSLWVVDRLVNGVTRIDLARPRKLGFVRVGADPLVAVFGYGALWVANSDDGTVSVIRPGIPKAQTIPVLSKPFGIDSGYGSIWVGSYGSSAVVRIDPELRRVIKKIDVAPPGFGESGLYDVAAGAGSIWAVNAETNDIARIDPRTNRVVAHIKLPVSPRVISVDQDQVWVSVGSSAP
jgi:DNA-binding SARP family transcriptional activator/DNA-binding beta-propeller fold protein YncE